MSGILNNKGRNKLTNVKERYESIELEVARFPLWLFKDLIRKDSSAPLTVRPVNLNTKGKESLLQIPLWLFKDLLRKDRSVPLTLRQVAALLKVHPATVQRWGKLGIMRIHSRSTRGNHKFLIADVVYALVNTPNLRRLFRLESRKPKYARI